MGRLGSNSQRSGDNSILQHLSITVLDETNQLSYVIEATCSRIAVTGTIYRPIHVQLFDLSSPRRCFAPSLLLRGSTLTVRIDEVFVTHCRALRSSPSRVQTSAASRPQGVAVQRRHLCTRDDSCDERLSRYYSRVTFERTGHLPSRSQPKRKLQVIIDRIPSTDNRLASGLHRRCLALRIERELQRQDRQA